MYKEARKIKYDDNITSGRSHFISSVTEDLFAYFISNNLKGYKYLVDQPISIEGFSSSIYPDISLVNDDNIISLIDVKIDLGRKRNSFIEFCKKQIL